MDTLTPPAFQKGKKVSIDDRKGDPNAGVYEIVEVLDRHRPRIRPAAKTTKSSVYSIGRSHHSHMRLSNCDFFFLDVRTYRDPNQEPDGPDKTMLGACQMGWLKEQLLASDAPFKVLASGSGWSRAKGSGGDSWAAFLNERDAFFQWLFESGIEGVAIKRGKGRQITRPHGIDDVRRDRAPGETRSR